MEKKSDRYDNVKELTTFLLKDKGIDENKYYTKWTDRENKIYNYITFLKYNIDNKDQKYYLTNKIVKNFYMSYIMKNVLYSEFLVLYIINQVQSKKKEDILNYIKKELKSEIIIINENYKISVYKNDWPSLNYTKNYIFVAKIMKNGDVKLMDITDDNYEVINFLINLRVFTFVHLTNEIEIIRYILEKQRKEWIEKIKNILLRLDYFLTKIYDEDYKTRKNRRFEELALKNVLSKNKITINLNSKYIANKKLDMNYWNKIETETYRLLKEKDKFNFIRTDTEDDEMIDENDLEEIKEHYVDDKTKYD